MSSFDFLLKLKHSSFDKIFDYALGGVQYQTPSHY